MVTRRDTARAALLQRCRQSIHFGAAEVATLIRQDDGTEIPIPTYEGHILVDEDGRYPAQLNTWEIEVVETELARPGTFAWYRNPSRTAKESLAIAYDDGTGRWKALRPDFLFFAEVNGEIVVDIVDPHGHHLADALPKLRGLAQFANDHGKAFRRIEALTQINGELKLLDLFNDRTREAIDDAESAEDLYLHIGRDYR